MKTSISRRLFITIFTVVMGISALIMLANSLLLKPFYFSSIKHTMLRAVETLSVIDYSDESNLSESIKEITAGSSYDVVVRMDEEVLYSDSKEFGLMGNGNFGVGGNGTGYPGISIPEESDSQAESEESSEVKPEESFSDVPDAEDNTPYGIVPDARDWVQLDDQTIMGIAIEPKTEIEMLICTRELDSGVTIILMQAVEPVNQSIRQANILLIACAVITLAISSLFVFKLSRQFTEPIRRIKDKVGKIAALNFDAPCHIKTGDELESLGNDVNVLGDKLKNALDTLRMHNEQLEKDIAAQKQFISNASHELRTPLSLIKGYADEMAAGYAVNTDQKELYINIIAEEAAKMSRLIKEMLELTRMECGRITMQSDTFNVRESIQAFLDKYDGYISENGLNVSVKGEEGMCGVFDPMYFEQILANYISNAARYGDGKKRIEISLKDQRDSIRIAVFNTGEPIPDDMMPYIWDGFYKADSARTRASDSYGLGLSIVKAIQTAAGQPFGMQNTPDGVEFWFEVARADINTVCKE